MNNNARWAANVKLEQLYEDERMRRGLKNSLSVAEKAKLYNSYDQGPKLW